MAHSLELSIKPLESWSLHAAVTFAVLEAIETPNLENMLHALDDWNILSSHTPPHPALNEFQKRLSHCRSTLLSHENGVLVTRWRLFDPRYRSKTSYKREYSPSTNDSWNLDVVRYSNGLFAKPSVAIVLNSAYMYRSMVDCLIASYVLRARQPVGVVGFVSPNVLEEI